MIPRKGVDEFQELLNGYAEESDRSAAANAPAPDSPGPQGEATTSSKSLDKAALFRRILAEDGYRSTIDEDGDLSLRIQGRWFVLFASNDDPPYFRLTIPNLFECADEGETEQALSLVNEMNRLYKVAKLMVIDGRVWCNVEMFLDPIESFRATFERCTDLLCEVCGDFQRQMRRSPEPA